jgi:hypothetical protein
MLHKSGEYILAVDVDAAMDIFLLMKKQVLVYYCPCTPDAAGCAMALDGNDFGLSGCWTIVFGLRD